MLGEQIQLPEPVWMRLNLVGWRSSSSWAPSTCSCAFNFSTDTWVISSFSAGWA